MSVSWVRDQWAGFLTSRIHAADPDTRTNGITGLGRLKAIQELRHYAEDEMGKQRRIEAAGWATIRDDMGGMSQVMGRHHGGFLSGGGGSVPKSVSVGRKGQGRVLTKTEVKKIAAKQRAEIKAARAAKRGKK